MNDNNNENQYTNYTSGENPGQLIPTEANHEQSYHHEKDQTYGYTTSPDNQRQQKKTYTLNKSGIAIIVIVCILLSSAFGFGSAMFASNYFFTGNAGVSNTSNANTTGFDLQDATGSKMTVQEVTKKAQDSVVEIKTESVSADSWLQDYVSEGAGSGVIIKSNGYILTNYHVINGASKIKVTTSDDKEYEATIVGSDADTDLAVLKIKAKKLSAATMGNSKQLNVGDMAVAIGNPLGELGGTVSAGIISALDRSLSIEGRTMNLLQTDTSINPGNSGGGLFNQYGQLIGIVVAKSSGSGVEGLGFAIPVNRAADVATQLMKGGHVKGKVTTGMVYTDMSASQDEFFGGGQSNGVYIQEVQGSNAKKSGFRAGDMVISVNNEKVDSIETLSSIITSHKVGDTVEYMISRNNKVISLKLTLEEKTN